MSPAVRIVHHTLAHRFEQVVIFSKRPDRLLALADEVERVVATAKLTYVRRQFVVQTEAQWGSVGYRFILWDDERCGLCGLRADAVFAHLDEFTEEEIGAEMKPLLVDGRLRLPFRRIEVLLIKQGLMTEDERAYGPVVADLLVNLGPSR